MSANQQISSPSSAGAAPAAPAANQQSSQTTWTEPPWSGWIETTGDALLILEAARRGLIPRVTRRLVDSERKMITSGSVFVFDEDESGIKRWTDGFFWSPSRILGNFLLYRETDKRGAGHRGARSDSADDHQYNDGTRPDGHSLSRPKGESSSSGLDRHRERVLVGSLTNSYKFKCDGLMKKVCALMTPSLFHVVLTLICQTFSLTIGGVAQHLISYYKVEDVEQGRLRSPSSLPELASLDISPEYLDKTHFRNPPKVEIGVDGIPRYRGEADDVDPSPSLLAAPLSTGLPLLTDGRISDGGKRGRYNPYGSGTSKRRKGGKNGTGSQSNSPTDNQADTLPIPSPSTPTSHSHAHSQGPPPSTAATPYSEQSAGVGSAGPPHPPPHPPYVPYPVGYYGTGYAFRRRYFTQAHIPLGYLAFHIPNRFLHLQCPRLQFHTHTPVPHPRMVQRRHHHQLLNIRVSCRTHKLITPTTHHPTHTHHTRHMGIRHGQVIMGTRVMRVIVLLRQLLRSPVRRISTSCQRRAGRRLPEKWVGRHLVHDNPRKRPARWGLFDKQAIRVASVFRSSSSFCLHVSILLLLLAFRCFDICWQPFRMSWLGCDFDFPFSCRPLATNIDPGAHIFHTIPCICTFSAHITVNLALQLAAHMFSCYSCHLFYGLYHQLFRKLALFELQINPTKCNARGAETV